MSRDQLPVSAHYPVFGLLWPGPNYTLRVRLFINGQLRGSVGLELGLLCLVNCKCRKLWWNGYWTRAVRVVEVVNSWLLSEAKRGTTDRLSLDFVTFREPINLNFTRNNLMKKGIWWRRDFDSANNLGHDSRKGWLWWIVIDVIHLWLHDVDVWIVVTSLCWWAPRFITSGMIILLCIQNYTMKSSTSKFRMLWILNLKGPRIPRSKDHTLTFNLKTRDLNPKVCDSGKSVQSIQRSRSQNLSFYNKSL